MRFTKPIAAVTLAAASVSFYALAAAGQVHADGRIIDTTLADRSTHGGRILHVPSQSDGDKTDGAPAIVTPRSWSNLPVVEFHDEPEDADDFEDTLPEPPGADRGVGTVVVVNRFLGDPCYSGGSPGFRAGDHFQAGGNMLRVPAEEDRFGRHACNRTRIFQRYLGFKRVYKGQVYTGFRKVYSGKRYLTGSY